MGDTTKRVAALNEKFAIKDRIGDSLRFEETPEGLTKIAIATPKVSAQIYTQGAHLTQWDVAGHKPGLFVSGRSEFAVGKPIRGGVPVLFPWFGPRSDGKEGPMHGFARIEDWTVDSTHVAADESVQVVLSLGPTEQSRQLGFDHFHLAIQFTLGAELHITLEVTNHGAVPLVFEEGLHSYFAVGDATRVTVEGLEGTRYIDKRDGFIHFSTAAQVRETAAKHFAGLDDLMLVAVDADVLDSALKWEVSRGGDLFPHLYGAMPLVAVRWAMPLPLDADRRHVFPELEP